MKIAKALSLLLGTAVAKEEAQDHCYNLAMSGGGTRGAYEVGVLWGMWYGSENKEQFEYDVVSGVSAGSLNGAAFGLFEKGDEEHFINVISELW